MSEFQIGDIVEVVNVSGDTNNECVGDFHIITDVTERQMWPIETEEILGRRGIPDAWFSPNELKLVYREGRNVTC